MMIKYKSDDGLENWKGRTMEKARQVKRVLLQAIKIAVGSSVAIYLAHILGLEYEASAGSITLAYVSNNKMGDGEIIIFIVWRHLFWR